MDLQALYTEEADYDNPIEPSSTGGEKLARTLCGVVLGHDFADRRTVVYP